MIYEGGVGIISFYSSASAASTTVSVNAIADKQFQIIGFSGGSAGRNYKVELFAGSTVKWQLEGLSGTSVSNMFGVLGPVMGRNTAVSVRTTPASSSDCTAALLYRIVS